MVGAGDDAIHQDRKKQDREGDLVSGFWTEGIGTVGRWRMSHLARDLLNLKSLRDLCVGRLNTPPVADVVNLISLSKCKDYLSFSASS